ncbi:DNA-formamidopyrimidine glycosylase [Thermincola ferriacetica]
MPELPEVETVKRSLEEKLLGKSIQHVDIFMDKVIKEPSVEEFQQILAGREILNLGRRGKYLLLYLSGGYVIVFHLRMTGQLIYSERTAGRAKHTHLVFRLSDDNELRFTDQRQFGRVYLLPDDRLDRITGLRTMGVEPLTEEFTKEFLKKELKRKRTKIKVLLLDQTFIAGIGNIYADEALFRAKINPGRLASTLNQREISRLHRAIVEVLTEGIENRGTSIKDYVDGEGKSGNYQDLLKVYGKEEKPCPVCGSVILRKKIGGRSSYYCGRCQKA